MKVDIDNFAKEIEKELSKFADDSSKKMEKIIAKAGRKGAKELREISPINRYHTKNKGRYRKGWKAKVVKGKLGHIEVVIHNKTDWQLTHLLENGFYHVKSNKQVKPNKHIAPVQQRLEAKVIQELKKGL